MSVLLTSPMPSCRRVLLAFVGRLSSSWPASFTVRLMQIAESAILNLLTCDLIVERRFKRPLRDIVLRRKKRMLCLLEVAVLGSVIKYLA